MDEIVTELQEYLGESIGADPSIVAVYLFGSRTRGEAKEESDIDIAFLLDENTYKSDPFEATAPPYMIATRIGMRLGKNTDVTILNSSSLELAYEVVTTGFCLYEQDPDKRLEYEATLRGMYYDFKPFLTKLRTKCIQRL
ncbi:MAG: nucleotidyltransferase domain-containing protein [Deltaproteobacteria bacterium]|nr:nucleotidyltransferase domain-containing protein [Deltaproteobacteria bacterium]